jgi:hypothetical protein
MTGRAFAFASTFVVLLGAVVSAAASCTGDDLLVGAIAPAGVPCLRITSPVDGQCVALSAAPGAYIPVSLDGLGLSGYFALRPPGACQGLSNCGYVEVSVRDLADPSATPVVNNLGSSTVVDVLFDHRIADRYGSFEITVRLLADDGSAWKVPDDAGPDASAAPCANAGGDGPYVARVTVTTMPSCEVGLEMDAGTDDAGDGGG